MAVPDLKVDPFGWISTLIFIVLTLLVRVFRLRDEFERPTLLFKGGKFPGIIEDVDVCRILG